MSEKYKFHDAHGLHFATSTVVHWIDLFTRKEFRHIIVESLKHCQQAKGLKIHAWCLMPSHLHMIISSDKNELSGIMRDFKKYTSKRIVSDMNDLNESRKEWLLRAFSNAGKNLNRIQDFKVWQDGNQPKGIETNQFLEQKLDYIHNNPVESEIVESPEHYLFSSARDYSEIKGLIEVDLIY
jgi:putative transposase